MAKELNWKPSGNNSVIVSWDYSNKDGSGLVIIGARDPLGIEQRIEIVNVLTNEEGLDILRKLGIDPLDGKIEYNIL